MISLPELQSYITRTKAPASARNYQATVQRFRQFLGTDSFSYEQIDSGFVAQFGNYLLDQGLTPASAGLFQRCLRALLKDTAPADRLPALKAAFAGVGSKNIKGTTALSIRQLRYLAASSLSAFPALRKIRAAYMYLLYAGGMSAEQFRATPLQPVCPQQEQLERQFRRENHAQELSDYITRLTADQYRAGLQALTAALRLAPALEKCSIADNWAVAAQAAGIQSADIAGIVPQHSISLVSTQPAAILTPRRRTAILRKTAQTISDLRQRWYAMRLFSLGPEELAARLQARALQPDAEPLSTFIAPLPHTRPGAKLPPGSTVMQTLLFVRSTEDEILRIASEHTTGLYLYTYRASKRPAHIPDADMKLFMLLADTARDTIQYHFPDAQSPVRDLRPGTRARIRLGAFQGYAGIIDRPGKDRYKIVIKIETLGGALITAELPAEFIEAEGE